jgi:HTH-type transcriptional regulator/antitoxin HipB
MDLKEIGAAFRAARRATRRTQGDLAAELGMSRATLSALEGGRCDEIGVRKLTALLESVGLDLLVEPRRMRPTLDQLRADQRRGQDNP